MTILSEEQQDKSLNRSKKKRKRPGDWEQPEIMNKPAGVFSPKLSRILPQKGAVYPSPAWLKNFESTVVTQNPMTIKRFFIIVIEKYLGKESNSKRCVLIFRSYRLKDKLT
ncbi:hypothetical protein AVEN_232717-1 [Araneus ventricosus]|uniref:Uncharacterized protein n=1 Tax=Araneus ventricosus TaxID=182803 RepID=A0A4Y2KNN0_ARAVE|nr:hypothetical protein AVEN_232717-1 [Araneus ventricosus]